MHMNDTDIILLPLFYNLFHSLEINWANIFTRSLSRTPEIQNTLLFRMLILSIHFLVFPTFKLAAIRIHIKLSFLWRRTIEEIIQSSIEIHIKLPFPRYREHNAMKIEHRACSSTFTTSSLTYIYQPFNLSEKFSIEFHRMLINILSLIHI